MRIWIRGFILLFFIAAVSFAGVHLYANLKGKEILIQKLEDITKRKVTIGRLSTSFPADVRVNNIEIEGVFKVDDVYAKGGLFDLFRKSFGLSELKMVNPEFTFERKPQEAALQDTPVPQGTPTMTITQLWKVLPFFYIERLVIRDGALTLIDNIEDKGKISIRVDDLNAQADNLNFTPRGSRITSFEITGRVPWRQGTEQGKIKFEGWINFFKKDMQADLKVEDIDAIALYPYYYQWVDLEKARIEKASLNFTSHISGLNNEITAPCHLELTDIVFRPRQADEKEEKAEKIAAAILGIFKTQDEGKVVLDFTYKTKMDQPQLGFGEIKTAVDEKIATARKGDKFGTEDVVMFPAKIVTGTVKGATDMTTAVIGGIYSVGKELGKALLAAFQREPAEE